jgi:hypothetical protein
MRITRSPNDSTRRQGAKNEKIVDIITSDVETDIELDYPSKEPGREINIVGCPDPNGGKSLYNYCIKLTEEEIVKLLLLIKPDKLFSALNKTIGSEDTKWKRQGLILRLPNIIKSLVDGLAVQIEAANK